MTRTKEGTKMLADFAIDADLAERVRKTVADEKKGITAKVLVEKMTTPETNSNEVRAIVQYLLDVGALKFGDDLRLVSIRKAA